MLQVTRYMIVIISGEPYQTEQFVKQQKDKKIKEGFEYYFFDASELQDEFEGKLLELLRSKSIFSRNKIVVARITDYKFIQNFIKEHGDSVKNDILMFFAPGQKKYTIQNTLYKIHHLDVPKGQALREFIRNEFSARGIKTDASLIAPFSRIGEKAIDLSPLIHEIEKISLAPQRWKELLTMEQDVNPFAITDAFARKEKERLFIILEREFHKGKKPFDVLGRILWQLRVLLLVHDLYKIQLHPFVIKKAREALNFFSPLELGKTYLKAISLYEETLFSSVSSELLLSRFFWQR